VEVPFRLTRRDEAAATDAFLLFADTVVPLADACTRFGSGTLPAVFAVHGGFVLVPAERETRVLPGAIRLRRLAGDLFIPANADLIPALLVDEAAMLTQNRGLVVLPGGDVLAFTASPLPIGDWLAPVSVRRESWEAFPARPYRPRSLSVIERPAQPTSLMQVLGQGAPDDAKPLAGSGSGSGEGVPEEARPPSGSTFRKFTASTGLAIGGFLAWVGKQLGAEGLARLGGSLARKALEAVPRLSEKVLGEQEAALREVLKQLQSGDIEKGLRRAPVAVGDPNQPARVGTDARLSNRDPRYSLRDLIGSGGGTATAWLGGGDIWNELAKVYRQLAEDATKRGDFRRAAYIYGVLLRDLRSAANVLLAGGLCRDAALLLRDRLNDPLAAAAAFERAGDHDEALRLYDKHQHFEKAAELLRRLGDEDRAVAYYICAADQLAGRGYLLGAGDLIRAKAGRRDLAIGYFRRGWQGITSENVTCGQRLLDEYFAAEDVPAVNALLAEGESNLAERPTDSGRFFNHALQVGGSVLPAEIRDDLADRVRLLFASHLRATAATPEGTRLAGELFRQSQVWPGPIVRDASFAVRERDRQLPAPAGPVHPPPVQIAEGAVTAVALTRGTFDVVVATTEQVVLWRMNENRRILVSQLQNGPIFALSVDPKGKIVYGLQNRGETALWCFQSDASGEFEPAGIAAELGEPPPTCVWYLQPLVAYRNDEPCVTVAKFDGRQTFLGPYLKASSTEVPAREASDTHLLIETPDGFWDWSDGSVSTWAESWSHTESDLPPGHWSQPWTPYRSGLGNAIDWMTPGRGMLEVAGVDEPGRVLWAAFDATNPLTPRERFAWGAYTQRYVASCLSGPGAVVAVTERNEVHWLRVAGKTLELSATIKLDVPTATVALVARPLHNEVVAILADGYAVRLVRP